jgi:hexosaminidase
VRDVRRGSDSRRRPFAAAACATLALALPGATAAVAGAVLPLPAEVRPGEGTFHVARTIGVRIPAGDAGARQAARYLADVVSRLDGPALRVGGPAAGAINFERRPGLAAEGYTLEIRRDGITIAATSDAGLFYGAVTLSQLLPARGAGRELAAERIRDQPVYPWRGLMLDSARHFQPPAFVKSMIDWMAWHKLNVLHWHLTDDQGWRLEIRKYPRLTSVGAWRTPATVGSAAVTRYGGYYTQADVRDIVAYAATRHVTIVPEIDMPGHARAATAAYPELGSTDGPAPPVSASWGVLTSLFNPDEATLAFLEDVLAEVVELFPGPYVHVGGDEAVKDEWRASTRVQARARELGREDPEALQAYFTERMGRFLTLHGRRLVGWDEVLRPELSRDAVVMSWHGTTGAHAAAVAGHDAVLTPFPTLYFDNRQSALPSEPPGRTRVVSLEDVFAFEPRDPTLSETEQRHVLGVQGNLWTEHIRSGPRLEWMALPRAAAVAELGWSPAERRRWPDFLARLAAFQPRYRALGVHAADSAFAVDAQLARSPDGVAVTLANQSQFGEIRYTTDGSEPGPGSAIYGMPLALALGTELRAATFMGAERISGTWSRQLDRQSLARRGNGELELCTDGVGLLLEPERPDGEADGIVAVDIMNPCWIYRGADLGAGVRLAAAVAPLPFNYELGADLAKVRIGDGATPGAALEVRIDRCDAAPVARLPLPADPVAATLAAVRLAPLPGRHDVCLRLVRPALEPLWAVRWVEIGE